MKGPAVEREIRGGLTILRLARPDTMNALTEEVKAALNPLVSEFHSDADARCLLITGSGNSFCAGGDLATLKQGSTPAQTRTRLDASHAFTRLLLSGEKPVITAVNGAAAGAGLGLALMGDIILASEDAYFLPGFLNVGVAADLALAQTLPRAIGVPRAKAMILMNRRVAAAEAAAIGLVSQLVPADKLFEEAVALGERLARGPTLAIGLTKRLVGQSFDLPLDMFLAAEQAAQTLAFASDDCMEGVDAYFEKRRPQFVGR